jgi:peroxiredoxin
MTTPWIVAFAAQWVFVLLVGLIVLGTFRRVTPLLERSEGVIASAARQIAIGGLAPGSAVPDFAVESVGGARFSRDDLLGRETTVVLFLGSGCRACERLVDDLEHDRVPDIGAQVVIVSGAPTEAHRLAIARNVEVLVDDHHELSHAFESAVTPHAFVVNGHGVVAGSGTPNEWEELRSLLDAAEGGDRHPDFAAAGPRS